MSKTPSSPAVRVSLTPAVSRALRLAKKRYPTLSDPEILKVGLAKIVTEFPDDTTETLEDVQRAAADSLNVDGYLDDVREDIYRSGMGKKTNFTI